MIMNRDLQVIDNHENICRSINFEQRIHHPSQKFTHVKLFEQISTGNRLNMEWHSKMEYKSKSHLSIIPPLGPTEHGGRVGFGRYQGGILTKQRGGIMERWNFDLIPL